MPVKNTSFCQTLSNLQRGSTIDELDQLLTDDQEVLLPSVPTYVTILEGSL